MSVSFLTLVELAANQVEPESWGPGVTTSDGPANVVTCSTFAMSAGGDTKALDGGWLWFTTGTLLGQERAIARDALALSGGDITVGNAYSTTTPSGASFQVHLRYPVTRGPGGTPWVAGYTAMLNDALSRLSYEFELAVSGVTNQKRYPLDIATHSWLADQPADRVVSVMKIDTTTNVKSRAFATWHIDEDAETPALIFDSGGFNDGDTFYLKVARPCNTRIKIAGVWTDVSASSLNNGVFGLYAPTDECHANERHVLAMAISESMNHLGMRQPAIDKATWEARRRYWASVAAGIKQARLPRPTHPDFRPVTIGGGRGSPWRRAR